MSEYQYYEFLAIDRPLSKEQMAELRALSTRATITPTRFQNVYNYGDFRGDPELLMERYFDAFVYVANWGTHWFMLRLPRGLLDVEAVSAYTADGQEGLTARVAGQHTVLSFRSEEEESEWEDGEEWMATLVPLRGDLASGDLRSLYLGWLAGVQYLDWSNGADSSDEDEEETAAEPPDEEVELLKAAEPPVPPGLGQLSAPLESLAEFLRLDRDLLAVAAECSAPAAPPTPRAEWERWLRGLPVAEKDAYLLRLVADGDTHVQVELAQRFWRERAAARPATARTAGRRTVGQLLRAASEQAERRRREEAERKARERAREERERAEARAKYLDGLAGREESLWRRVEALVEAKKAKEYDEAVRLLVDLRDLAARAGSSGEFAGRLSELRVRHAKKPAFIERLDRARLRGAPPV